MANPIGPVTVPSMPGRVVAVTPSNSATFPPSVIVAGVAGDVVATPAIPSGATDVTWTFTGENFILPGLYIAVKATGTTATGIKRIQVNE